MKKCMLMFTLLIAALILAALTEGKKDSELEPKLVTGEEITENMTLDVEARDSIR